jgi:hypothetical protein
VVTAETITADEIRAERDRAQAEGNGQLVTACYCALQARGRERRKWRQAVADAINERKDQR